jgi:pyrroline-5-carboxylate reductase
MSVSILEALQNAQANLRNVRVIGMGIIPLIQSQLDNAVTLLEKGYDLDEEVEPLLEEFGSVENVPEKQD